MNELTKYNLKQIIIANNKIERFEINNIDLNSIICDLTGLLNALEFVSDPWKNDFQSEINFLEMIHDCIEDGSIIKWEGNYKEDLHDAIVRLKKTTNLLLEKYLENSDPNILEYATIEGANWFFCPKCKDAWGI